MCGILGIWNREGSAVDQQELDRFTDSLAHRGPDGRGTYIDEKACLGFGHRRLAILDLTDSGHQPMPYGDGRYWITYNGEIYNFLELRTELERLGHRFRSESDTEVILAAYVQWGESCQFKFNGMWGFAIWDSHERKLFLSRDRFGIKPLFYIYDGKHFVFASELKAFMALSLELQPEFDLNMISLFANTESARKTILKGVKNLNGGHQLVLHHNGVLEITQWWHTKDHLVEVPCSFEDQVEHYRALFLDACKIRMRSDVPICSALSGGLDSSSVLCSMAYIRSGNLDGQRLAKDWQKAFLLDYTSTVHSEKKHAQVVIDHTGAIPVFKEIPLSDISAKDIIEAVYSLETIDEPALGPWYIYREMRRHGVLVSMDGHGGDETLAGYHHYPKVALQDAVWPWQKKERFKDIQETLRGLWEEKIPEGFDDVVIPSRMEVLIKFMLLEKSLIRPTMMLLQANPVVYQSIRSVYREALSLLSSDQAVQGPGWTLIAGESSLPLKEEHLTGCVFDYLNRELYQDFHVRQLPRHLRDFDRMSMAHGVEIHVPFLDWRLVTYAFSLPSDAKLGEGFTKRILREAMRDILPESIRTRRSKIGFASPMKEWYKNGLKSFVLDSVNSREFIESEIWKGPVIRDFVEDCYRKEDYLNATKSWRYIQAMILMRSFKQKAYTHYKRLNL